MNIRLHHVQITVPPEQVEEARAFYGEVLGLPEIPKPESLRARGGFWLLAGDRAVHVGVESGVDRTRTKAHVAYEVTDLGRWRARLEGAGIAVEESVSVPGLRRFEFRDPFGNRVEILETLDAGTPTA